LVSQLWWIEDVFLPRCKELKIEYENSIAVSGDDRSSK
jgi:energy-converting hydrogenase A subunit M